MVMDKSKEKNQVDSVVCEECGSKIPAARLKVMQDARFCVKCQEEYEHNHPTDDSKYLTEPDPSELNDIVSPDF
jgi:phage/conjugal plasmid C-4 type zinc finger TraR family protein